MIFKTSSVGMFYEIEEIKRRRKKLGLTQKKLAELVGVSQPLIARLESGDLDPKLSLIKKIFKVLDELEGKMTAKKIMNPNVIFATPEDSPKKIIEIMWEKGISQVPVIDNKGKNIGCVTESAIIRQILEKGVEHLSELKVKDIMEDPLPTVPPDESLENISKMLLNNPAILVVERDKVIGIITKHDVMKVVRG